MKTQRLLKLYPGAWRDRYGEEFVALLEDRPPGAGATFDIILGAMDARLSSKARIAAPDASTPGGGIMTIETLRHICHDRPAPRSWRDIGIATAIILGGSMVFSGIGGWFDRHGWSVAGQMARTMAFPGTLALAVPFMWLRGKPWRAQVLFSAVLVGLLLLLA